ncbi:MAG: hypothetical protein MJ102_06250 [Clostridia bacterium]|nr:hypothetical protein [Clostridia bacterium]
MNSDNVRYVGRSSLITYTAGHFLVDFACGYILFNMYAAEQLEAVSVSFLFIFYNLLAFGTQFALGAVSDMIRSNGSFFAVIGCILTAAGLAVGGNIPYLTVTLIGLGNAAFHVGGGTDALTRDNSMTRAGIFVSTGTLGIALGSHMGTGGKIPVVFLIALLVTVAVSVFAFCTAKRRIPVPDTEPDNDTPFSRRSVLSAAGPAVAVLMIAVFIRSWVGFTASFPESDSKFAFLLPACAAFAGKFVGGILADLIGARRVAAVSVLLSAPLFFLGGSRFLFFLAAVFLFNIAMPVTLVELARRLPRHEGFAIGLTTLALFAGYLLSTVLHVSSSSSPLLTALLAVVAAAAVAVTASDRRN